MLSRFLSVAAPLSIYIALAILVWALIRERRRWEWFALVPALAALLASSILVPLQHQLFFDEDIYIHIASNLTKAPVAQVTLLGTPEHVEASVYYKVPPGYPVLLSFIFMITGASETAAFLFGRLIYVAAVASVYTLARTVLGERKRALAAALMFAALPACFGFSGAASTDLVAALFAVIGMLGVYVGSGPLAAAGLAIAALTRLDAIVLLPILLLAPGISRKWKLAGLCLAAVAGLHLLWLLSIAPALAQSEHVEQAFSANQFLGSASGIVKYLFNPLMFPTLVVIVAAVSVVRRNRQGKELRWKPLTAWAVLSVSIFITVKDGSFLQNPRYSIQASIPAVVLAASAFSPPAVYVLAATTLVPHFRELPDTALRADHQVAAELASKLSADDIVVTAEPELFLNRGIPAMNVLYASERKDRLLAQFKRYKRVLYYQGIRASMGSGPEWEADRWIGSSFELRKLGAADAAGAQASWYELLQLGHGQTR